MGYNWMSSVCTMSPEATRSFTQDSNSLSPLAQDLTRYSHPTRGTHHKMGLRLAGKSLVVWVFCLWGNRIKKGLRFHLSSTWSHLKLLKKSGPLRERCHDIDPGACWWLWPAVLGSICGGWGWTGGVALPARTKPQAGVVLSQNAVTAWTLLNGHVSPVLCLSNVSCFMPSLSRGNLLRTGWQGWSHCEVSLIAGSAVRCYRKLTRLMPLLGDNWKCLPPSCPACQESGSRNCPPLGESLFFSISSILILDTL